MLVLKLLQNQLCWGIELPHRKKAKISKFAEGSTLILEDTTSLSNAMSILSSFGLLSGLQLDKKKNNSLVEKKQARTFEIPVSKRSHKVPWHLLFP